MADYKDLPIILKLNSKIRYSNPKDVQTTYEWAVKGEKLKTPLGQKYMKRLGQIMDGTDLFAGCLICEKDLDNDSVICTSCQNKSKKLLQTGKTSATRQAAQTRPAASETQTAQEEPAINFNDITQKVKETTKTVARGTEKAAKEVKNKLSEQMESENVKKAVDKSKKASRSAVSFWKALPKKTKLIVMSVLVVVVVLAALQGGRKGTSDISSGESGDWKNAQNLLEETLEELYPNMEFKIEYTQKIAQYPNVFKGELGKVFDPANSGGETLPVFIFNALASEKGKNQYALNAVCMVTDDGRITARGNLISEANSSGDYRIR